MARTSRIRAAAAAVALVALSACGPAQTTTPAPVVEPAPEVSPEQSELGRHINLGDQYLNSKLPAKAIEEFQKALALDEANAEVLSRLGYAYVEAEDYEKAVRTYRRFVEVSPQDCTSHASLGFAYMRQGLTEQAIVAYEKALTICPEDPNAYNNMARAYKEGGYEIEAMEAYRRAVELNPSDILAYESLAALYWERKLFPEAIATYVAILDHPDNGKDAGWTAWASQRVGNLYKWAAAYEEALPFYTTALNAAPDDDKLLRNVAICYEELGQTDRAIQAYEALIAHASDKPLYYYRLGELLNDVGRYEDALRRVKEGKTYDTECSAHAHAVMGRAYEKMGSLSNFKRAQREFKRCVACGDANFADYCSKQVERQGQLIKIEELKRKKDAGY